MTRYIWAALLLGAVVFALPAPAVQAEEPSDPATLTCADRQALDQRILLAFWLDGYMRGETGRPSYDDERFDEVGLAVARACQNHPDRTLLSILREMETSPGDAPAR